MLVYYTADTGDIQYTFISSEAANQTPPAGDYIKVSDQYFDLSSYKVEDGLLVYTAKLVTSAEVHVERDRRLVLPFFFGGVLYDCDEKSLARITGAATLAGFAAGAGAPTGYHRWHGGDTDFMWIAADNSLNVMDAQTCFGLGQAAANHQSNTIFAADILKRQNPIPTNFTDDVHWL